MTRIHRAGEGEALTFGPQWPGQIRLLSDPAHANPAFAMGSWTLPPGAAIPLQRHPAWDQVWVVHKGQGRATVEQDAATVLPGSMVTIPRQSWYRMRNTGTGLLQGVWVASPAGLERSLRELAQRGGADPGAFQQVAQQVGIELRFEPEAAAAPARAGGGRRRHRRGGRAHAPPPISAPPQSAAPESPPVAATPPVAPPAGPPSPSGKRHRRRRRGRRGGGGRPPATGVAPSVAVAEKPSAKPAAPAKPSQPSGRPPRRDHGRRRFGRVKEVYMGGRWVRVQGEGPVISTGEGPRESETP